MVCQFYLNKAALEKKIQVNYMGLLGLCSAQLIPGETSASLYALRCWVSLEPGQMEEGTEVSGLFRLLCEHSHCMVFDPMASKVISFGIISEIPITVKPQELLGNLGSPVDR